MTHSTTFIFSITTINTLFSDGFEGNGWTTATVSGTSATWTVANSGSYPTASPHSGTKLADFNSFSSLSMEQARLYRNSGFAIPGTAGTVTLQFWMYHDTDYKDYRDRVQAQISTDGSTWSNVGVPVLRYDGTPGWAPVSIDLSAYRGQANVQLGFLGTSDYGNDIYLDDVSVVTQGGLPQNFTVTVFISGAGAVNSTPNDPLNGIACTPRCTSIQPAGSSFTLNATRGSSSLFGGWSGACSSCGSSPACLVIFDADKSCTANFTQQALARIGGTTYPNIFDAYAAAATGALIEAQAVTFVGDLVLNRGIEVKLKGGYDAAYSLNPMGMTTVEGQVIIGTGRLTADRLTIR